MDSLWRFKMRCFLVLLSGFLGVTSQVGVIGLAVYYARVLERGDRIQFLAFDFEPHSSGLLVLFALGVIICLLCSAWLIYFSGVSSLKLRRRYEEFCSKRIISLFGSSLRIWTPDDQRFSDDGLILKLARRDARYCGRVQIMIMNAVVPAITFLAGTVALLYINVPLTLFVVLLMGVSAVFQFRANVSGARSSISLEKHAIGAGREYKQIIGRLKGSGLPLLQGRVSLDEMLFSSGETKRYLDAYEGRLKVVESSKLVSNMFLAISVSIILLTFGTDAAMRGEGWGKLIVYLIALRYVLVNLTGLSTRITGINRFYPQLRRYLQFLVETEIPSASGESRDLTYTLTSGPNPMEGSLKNWDLSVGKRIGLISPFELNRHTRAFLTDCLLGRSSSESNSALGSMGFVTSKYGCLPMSLRKSLGFPKRYSWQDMQKELNGTGLLKRLGEQLPDSLDKRVANEAWGNIDPDLKFALRLLAVLHSPAQWVMLEEEGLRALTLEARKVFLERLSDRITVIVYCKDTSVAGSYDEEMLAVVDARSNSTVGLGSVGWFEKHRAEVEQFVRMSSAVDSEKGGVALETEDDELDDDI